jgi:hypothetical protein
MSNAFMFVEKKIILAMIQQANVVSDIENHSKGHGRLMYPCPSVRLAVGDIFVAEMPFSECCMHVGVAGKVMVCHVKEYVCQLYDVQGDPYSGGLTWGEAGVLGGQNDMHCYGLKIGSYKDNL